MNQLRVINIIIIKRFILENEGNGNRAFNMRLVEQILIIIN